MELPVCGRDDVADADGDVDVDVKVLSNLETTSIRPHEIQVGPLALRYISIVKANPVVALIG